jgi:signal transduction histidine kinase/DNA-binding response OmpR family regulator
MSTEPGAGAQPNQSEPIDILTGGGDMGRLARALDWSRTPVGAPATWPQSLRTALSILLESKFPMLLCWGPDFTQFYNDPFRPILGLNKHPALGKSTRETFAEAWHIIGPLFDQVMRGHAVGFEDMLVPLDRSGFLEECYFVYSYSPIRVESGAVGGVLVTCTETSGRVIAERRLRMLGELSAQAARANDAPTAWTCAAPVLASNPSDLPFFLLYALESDGRAARVVSQSPAAPGPPVIVADDPNPAWPIFGANASQGPAFVSDVRRRFGDHAGLMWPDPIVTAVILPITRPGLPQPYGFLVAAVSPRLALDDKYREFLVLVADQIATAVANARAHEEERQRTEALIELDRQKTAFFSNVSHEFRTPLTLLLGPLEDALSRGPRTLATSELELVHRNALRLLRLVNTLLDFSRIEAGRAQPKFEETDLAGLTRDIASTFQSVMDHAGLDYAIDVPASVPASIDVAMWEKVLLNLLSNAFKFTLRGGVRVQLRESPQGITLSVQDTGSGIPASEAPHVFDRFHRVGGTPARTFEGSGIGLALVRELVHMHGGDIAVESVEGQGSTFTVTMPVRPIPSVQIAPTLFSPPVEAAAPFLEEARRWIGTPTPGPEDGGHHVAVLPADHGPARILVADDNADMREYLQRLLAGTWTIELAANGREALARLATAMPDLILADVMMPELDGLALLREVRARRDLAGIPVILLSARSGEESRVEGLTAGADDYIVKPFSARELIARVHTQIEVSRLRRETATQNERLLTLIQVAPAAIAVVRGPDHVYELANARYFEIVGRRDIIGRPGREALPELVGQGIWNLFDHVYATGDPYVARELRIDLDRLGNGALDEGFFTFVLQPLKNVRGDTDGILIHAVEVTEQVLARRAVDEARASAESANRAKDEFLAMLGHELRNPLAPILTALQLMTLRGDSGGVRERAVIDRQVRHVVRLVDDLLDVARIARGKIDLKREHVEVGPIVAKAIEMTSPLIEQKHHTVVVDLPAAGLVVDGDPIRLQQIVFNLLNNAVKYTEPRGRIWVSARQHGDSIELGVRDSGIGIAPAMLPHVFDLFVQDRQALDRSQGGLGLGLAIVRNMVELHGGRVSAASEGVGRGSEFLVTLPASRAPVGGAGARPPEPPPAVVTAGLRVLIVDDNDDAAQFLAEALALSGFETRTATDGVAALAEIDAFKPHVALLDLGLPVMDGFELAERLRQRVDCPRLIAVTGYGTERDQSKTQSSGFETHLVKPVDLNALVNQLRAMSAQPSEGG